MAHRLKAMGVDSYRNGFTVATHKHAVTAPLAWKKPRTIFVNSMSDLFHEEVPVAFIHRIFDVMEQAHWHQFQILTKRADRLAELSRELPWPQNVWMGVSVETPQYYERIRLLRRAPAAVRFVSAEPLLAALPRIPLAGIDWLIAGGESGPGARPMDADWVRYLRDRCNERGVPFFFKQWGGTRKKLAGRVLDGRTWDDMPTPILRQRTKLSLSA